MGLYTDAVMTLEEVTATGRAVCAWMLKHGYPGPSRWLAERVERIASSDSASERENAKREIHGAIPGMGGLGDLAPSGKTREERDEARSELRRLIERLYSLTGS